MPQDDKGYTGPVRPHNPLATLVDPCQCVRCVMARHGPAARHDARIRDGWVGAFLVSKGGARTPLYSPAGIEF